MGVVKIAVVLSGSVRNPEKSLETLKWFAGHETSVFIHAWRNVALIKNESFSKRDNLEPTAELFARYRPEFFATDDWEKMRKVFLDDLNRWKVLRPDTIPAEVNNIGFHGMYFSLARASARVLERIADFDMIVRLRFDCWLLDQIAVAGPPGWVVPEGHDFFGLNDQLAWFRTYPGDPERSRREAEAYFGVYSQLDGLIRGGCLHGPEVALKANFDRLGVAVTRVPVVYTIF